MVSHSIDSNVVFDQQVEREFDLWAHLKQVKACSFNKALKRKRERDEEINLCSSFSSLGISRKSKPLSLEARMKKLCLGATTDDLGDSIANESCAIVQDAKTTSNCVFGGVGAVGQHNLSQKCDDAVLPPMQDGSSLSLGDSVREW